MNDKGYKGVFFKKGDTVVCVNIHDKFVIGKKYITSDDSFPYQGRVYVAIEDMSDYYSVEMFMILSKYRKNKINKLLDDNIEM